MNDQTGLLHRIGRWFRRGNSLNGDFDARLGDGANGDLPLEGDKHEIERMDGSRSTFLRPWAKRDAAINALQGSFESLNDLMQSIRENLEGQSRRQDELIAVFQRFPELLQNVPEQQRMHGEALRVISGQLEQQNSQHAKMTEILGKVGEAHTGQQALLDSLNARMEALGDQDEAIADNLKHVGSAMQTVSRSSESSAAVLSKLHDNMGVRDAGLERILHKQNTRFTTMLSIAIFLSVAALVAVVVMGYLIMTRGH